MQQHFPPAAPFSLEKYWENVPGRKALNLGFLGLISATILGSKD